MKAWFCTVRDIVKVARFFFKIGKLLKAINSTLITPGTKVENSSFIHEYRVIACCTVMSQIIAKLLVSKI